MGGGNKKCCSIPTLEGDNDELHLKPLKKGNKKRLNSHMFEIKNNLIVLDTP